MSYADRFDREVILDIDKATELAVKVVMKEGELRFRDTLIQFLEKDVAEYLDEVDGDPNMEWVDGVRYVIQLVREADFDGE